MAQSAWEYQSKIEVPDDEAETEHEVQMGELEAEWQSNWTGPRSKGKSKRIDEIPAVYAFVPKESLPRSAKVEWQLTAHTGQPVQNEDDDGEEMALPESETGEFLKGDKSPLSNAKASLLFCSSDLYRIVHSWKFWDLWKVVCERIEQW